MSLTDVFRKSSSEYIVDQIFPLSDGAYRLHDAARQWCVHNQKDGHIPASVVRGLTKHDPKSQKKYVAELVTADLWFPQSASGESMFFIPQTNVDNFTRAQLAEHLAKKSAAGKKGNAVRWSDGSNVTQLPAASGGRTRDGKSDSTRDRKSDSTRDRK
ncbi:MAG TPA: hypothetical protein VGH11_13450 [Jatrophihabitans sp.]|jgi:hypothetical protein